MPRNKPVSERIYVDFDRALKRLWENANAVDRICDALASHQNRAMTHAFPHIRGETQRHYSVVELRNSANSIREDHVWDWSLIVAFALTDAWLQDAVNHLHSRFPDMLATARSRRYNAATPSFSTSFFENDKAGITLAFPSGDPLVTEFVKWKEARNCLVHHGGRVSSRYAALCTPHPPIGKKLKITSTDARMACRAIFLLADEVQWHIRKEFRRRRVRP